MSIVYKRANTIQNLFHSMDKIANIEKFSEQAVMIAVQHILPIPDSQSYAYIKYPKDKK